MDPAPREMGIAPRTESVAAVTNTPHRGSASSSGRDRISCGNPVRMKLYNEPSPKPSTSAPKVIPEAPNV